MLTPLEIEISQAGGLYNKYEKLFEDQHVEMYKEDAEDSFEYGYLRGLEVAKSLLDNKTK